jgi:nitroimidazol reductase NimA-like FMN-containing flavoprotein (pyridoxamine 5'-phosphate oxidase superfamily)
MASAAPSARTRIKRAPKRARYDRETVDAILDESLIGHVGFAPDGQPFVIPMLIARDGDQLYLHGSSASRLMKTLAEGIPACVSATLVDGLVLARSAFHHSVNYRSAVVLGRARGVDPPEERMKALELFTEKLVPGRWDEVRGPSRKELKATRVLVMDLDEATAKVRTGPPVDDEPDYELPVWAGVLPLATTVGAPVPDPQLRPGTEVPGHVTSWRP